MFKITLQAASLIYFVTLGISSYSYAMVDDQEDRVKINGKVNVKVDTPMDLVKVEGGGEIIIEKPTKPSCIIM